MAFDLAAAQAAAAAQLGTAKRRPIDLIRQAFSTKMEKIEIPEWPDENGQPMAFYFGPMTAADLDILTPYFDKESKIPQIDKDLTLLVYKARDANGQQMFLDVDKPLLKTTALIHVLRRLLNFMWLGPALTVEEAKDEIKNGDGSAQT
jgi:hypothetical protein